MLLFVVQHILREMPVYSELLMTEIMPDYFFMYPHGTYLTFKIHYLKWQKFTTMHSVEAKVKKTTK